MLSALDKSLIKNPRQYNMKLKLLQELNNHGPPPLISFKNYPPIRKNPGKKQDSLKVKINTQPGEADSKNIFLYVPISKNDYTKALLKFLVILNNYKGKEPKYAPPKVCNDEKLLMVESLRVFEQKVRASVNKTLSNYELFIQGLTTDFFSPNEIKLQKSY